MELNKHNGSYKRHICGERSFSRDKLPSCYSSPNSIDAWRHRRMLNCVLPLLSIYPGAIWMTIGDGNYGTDAYFLKTNGADVLATGLTEDNLAYAKKKDS